MGLSPLKVKKLISFGELARALSGLELYPAPTHEEMEWHWEWEDAIRDAILDGSLQPVGQVQVMSGNLSDQEEYMPPLTLHDFSPRRDCLIAKFKRQDIHTWLIESGHSDSDIPDALKSATVTKQAPRKPSSKDQQIHHRRKETYLKLIEALVLEALGEIPKEPYKTAGRLELILEKHGLTLNKEPIADTIREIQKAREERDP